jgi:hypothetical protein
MYRYGYHSDIQFVTNNYDEYRRARDIDNRESWYIVGFIIAFIAFCLWMKD